METNFFFKNMAQGEQKELREYFFSKASKFEKIVSRFPEDGVKLQVKGEKFQKHSAYDVELTMKLPSETLLAREASHTIMKAVDLAKDRLDMQLKKSVSLARRGHRSIKARSKMKMKVVETV
ncbi:HPF/RaiA family ribosome-associated protein [Candidatus Peregrinibacteria bacterium]|nr:HPF/RaiA family ribosome-associated protein [Candidatus Peregrinibacteria bacterium]